MPANSTFTDLVTSTFRLHGAKVIDNVSKNNALFAYVKRKGNMEGEDGGLTIVENLDYAENGTYQRYSDFDVLNISQSEIVSAAEFQWRQIAINVVASGREMRINSGKSQIFKLAKARITNAMRTFKNNFSADMYSSGSLANQINGLQALVADAGTGTVGGIDSSTWTFWKNKVQSAAAPLQGGGAITPGPTTMESLMLPLWLELTRGDDKPDLIVSSNDYYTFFEQSQTSIKRYTDKDQVSGGFTSLKYKNADVIFDGGSGIPTAHMYFLNTDYIKVRYHNDANMTVMDDKSAVNQDASVIPILWMGNMTVSNRALQGVLKA